MTRILFARSSFFLCKNLILIKLIFFLSIAYDTQRMKYCVKKKKKGAHVNRMEFNLNKEKTGIWLSMHSFSMKFGALDRKHARLSIVSSYFVAFSYHELYYNVRSFYKE